MTRTKMASQMTAPVSAPTALSVTDTIWADLRHGAENLAKSEPLLANLVTGRILNAASITDALATLLSEKLDRPMMDAQKLGTLLRDVYARHPQLGDIACQDIAYTLASDPAAKSAVTAFLFFKGFHALQSWRVANILWHEGREALALFLQNRISMVFDIDIHPAAKIGHSITLDHASGIVIGETAIVGNRVLMLHAVTLGTRGFERGDRHPIIGDDVIIGAGAKILGRITIGNGARVAAGSLVLADVAPDHTVAGVPARVVKQG